MLENEMNQEKQNCGKCIRFIPHYVKIGKKFVTIGFGHCVMRGNGGYLKLLSKACDKFLMKHET